MTDSEQMAELLARNAAMLDSMGQLLAGAQQQLAHVQQLNRDLRARTGLAQSPDRMVTVVVDGAGGLRRLSFDRDAFEHHTPVEPGRRGGRRRARGDAAGRGRGDRAGGRPTTEA